MAGNAAENLCLQPKTAFARFLHIRKVALEGQPRVDFAVNHSGEE
jgi:hypothetical protein